LLISRARDPFRRFEEIRWSYGIVWFLFSVV